jgi:Na+/H+ antiporter NhaD/arsenite permease-like protein
MSAPWIAGGVFLITYALIVTERLHRTVAALLGGMAIIALGVLAQEEAFAAVDWNVIFLLAGMMVIANVLRETGVFQWVAVQAVRLGQGQPFRILVILSLVTAVTSAFLDNVTVVVLVAPVTLFVTAALRVSPVPFLVAEILAANIGGTATLIGDPPNILIGSAAGIDFLTFAANMVPVSLLILAVFVGMAWVMFRRDLGSPKMAHERTAGGTSSDDGMSGLGSLDTTALITNRPLLVKGLVVLAAVILGFFFQGALHIEPATVAMAGATVLLLWSGIDPHHALRDVEWTTLFFFIGLFVLVEGIVHVGIIDAVAQGVVRLTGGSLQLAAISLLWVSALLSAVVDNIPYTAAMIPVVQDMGKSMPIGPLWWALALGACLGGNATLVGASANVVVASLAERGGQAITFKRFLVYGLPVTILSLLIATVYLSARYLVNGN